MALPNLYHLRRVAASASKPCFICYKPTDAVLITPDNRDFFYTCAGHLTDRGFATPVVSKEEEEAKKKKEELEKEIEQVKKDYEEKMKKKKNKKSKDKDKDKDKESDKKSEKSENPEEERDQKIKDLEKAQTDSSAKADGGPRVFTLHKNVYEMRINRLKNIQAAKRNQERQQQQGSMIFPSAPTGDP